MIRSAASLRRVPVGRVPRLQQYYQRTPTSRRPSRRTSSSFAWRYLRLPCSLPQHGPYPRAWAACSAVPAPRTPSETSRPPRFLGDPCLHAPLSDPGGTGRARPSRRADGAFHSCHSVGFRDENDFVAQSRGLQGFLCTLRRQRHHCPRNTRFRLAGQPWPVRTRTCWVAKKVSVTSHNFPLHQASPGARQARPLYGPRSLRGRGPEPAHVG